ncbi:MAG: hypothetical protein AAGJ81_10780 [Verrucomicrobiota bacterium]
MDEVEQATSSRFNQLDLARKPELAKRIRIETQEEPDDEFANRRAAGGGSAAGITLDVVLDDNTAGTVTVSGSFD